jgi:hypothetical protein
MTIIRDPASKGRAMSRPIWSYLELSGGGGGNHIAL